MKSTVGSRICWDWGGVSKLLNYVDEEFISKSYFALVPEPHLHLRAVSF